MSDVLTDADYAHLSCLQHERLRSHFPSELQDATLMTRHDATLVVGCDWETIALLNEAWNNFTDCAYQLTGCNTVTFFVDDELVLTQARAVQLQLPTLAKRQKAMVATMEQVKTTLATLPIAPSRTLFDVVQELTDLLAAITIAKVEARAPSLVNGLVSTPAPTAEADAPLPDPPAPGKLPGVRLKGIYTPTKSNWVQSAKRYLKAVDPSGNAAKTLMAIVEQNPTGQAHIERALREYPQADRDMAKEKLHKGFLKIATERGLIGVEAQ